MFKIWIRKCSPTEKKVVLLKQSSKCSNSRKTKTFLKGLEEINQGSEYPRFSRWLCNTFSKETFSIKDFFPVGKKREQQKLIETEVKGMLKKGAIRQASTYGEFLSNLFPVKNKDGWGRRGGQRPVINLKHLNAFIPYNHFKMEGLHNLRYLLQEGVCTSSI